MQAQDILELFRSHANNSLQTLDMNTQQAVNVIQKDGLTGSEAKAALAKLYASTPFLTDCSILDSSGVMVVVEPPAAKNLEGTDLSKQEQVKELRMAKKPVLSKMFMAVEGVHGIVLQYPVFSPTGELIGSVSAFFKPQAFFSPLAETILKDTKFEVWIIDDAGNVIYDQDKEEIGKNIFTDEMYKSYPDCIKFAENAIKEDSGKGSYDFLEKGLNAPIKKEGLWAAVSLNNTKWHIVVVEAKGKEATLKQLCSRQAMDDIIKNEAQTAISLLSAIYSQYESGKFSLDEAKKQGADLLRSLRYGDNQEGYFWADTVDGVNVVLYGKKEVEGTNRYEANINGIYYVKEIIEKGKQPGGGFTDYWFPKKGEETPSKKRGYSLLFKPFGWVVGTGYYPDI
ncbi:MAG: cache domain-containing protein [Candidatus Omnitrophica bacterium]|nr:cache domain-containing protein [Candidatus Omnitrophota bacterium]